MPVSITLGGTGNGILTPHAEDIRKALALRIVVTLGGEASEFTFVVSRPDQSPG